MEIKRCKSWKSGIIGMLSNVKLEMALKQYKKREDEVSRIKYCTHRKECEKSLEETKKQKRSEQLSQLIKQKDVMKLGS